uniref:hypothetical protein n=1 Tax=Azospirillum argentinense TaxID=2970906 RepID=UPI0010BFDC22|nr:hypothetical protein [Azospirillum argentinense]
MPFAAFLDKIWHSPEPRREIAGQVATLLQADDVTDAAMHLWCAYNQRIPLRVEHSVDVLTLHFKPEGHISLSVHARPGWTPFCKFIDIGTTVYQSQPTGSNAAEMSMASLLASLQIARDHSDSLLCLPTDKRKTRLQEYSHEAGITIDLMASLISNFYRIDTGLYQ